TAFLYTPTAAHAQNSGISHLFIGVDWWSCSLSPSFALPLSLFLSPSLFPSLSLSPLLCLSPSLPPFLSPPLSPLPLSLSLVSPPLSLSLSLSLSFLCF